MFVLQCPPLPFVLRLFCKRTKKMTSLPVFVQGRCVVLFSTLFRNFGKYVISLFRTSGHIFGVYNFRFVFLFFFAKVYFPSITRLTCCVAHVFSIKPDLPSFQKMHHRQTISCGVSKMIVVFLYLARQRPLQPASEKA